MSRITKEIAADVAKKLIEKRVGILSESIKIHSDRIREQYMGTVPKDVIEFLEKNESWLKKENMIRCRETRNYIILNKSVPVTNGYPELQQSKEDLTLMRKNEKERDDIQILKRSIEEALYNLRTYKNVESEFPEAVQYLPKRSVNTSLVISLSKTRSEIA